jgi:hypothetical protein
MYVAPLTYVVAESVYKKMFGKALLAICLTASYYIRYIVLRDVICSKAVKKSTHFSSDENFAAFHMVQDGRHGIPFLTFGLKKYRITYKGANVIDNYFW